MTLTQITEYQVQYSLKPQGHKVEFINEGIDHTHRIVFDDSRSLAPQ